MFIKVSKAAWQSAVCLNVIARPYKIQASLSKQKVLKYPTRRGTNAPIESINLTRFACVTSITYKMYH